MYPPGEYDLAGFAVGVVEKRSIIDGRGIAAGDVVLGLASSGAHSNGYSLMRKILERSQPDLAAPFDGQPFARRDHGTDAHLREAAARAAEVAPGQGHGAHHRRRPHRERAAHSARAARRARSTANTWPLPPLFDWLQEGGQRRAQPKCTAPSTAASAFVIVVDRAGADAALTHAARSAARRRSRIGRIRARRARTADRDRLIIVRSARHPHLRPRQQHAGDAAGDAARCASPRSSATAPSAAGLEIARAARRPHARGRPPGLCRPRCLRCDAGCRRSTRYAARFRACWRASCASSATRSCVATPERLVNIHPSLLPAFPGSTRTRAPSQTACRVHGCTVHFVTARARSRPDHHSGGGAGAAPTTRRIRSPHGCCEQEHRIYPQAVRWLCEDRVSVDAAGRVAVAGESPGKGTLVVPAIEV